MKIIAILLMASLLLVSCASFSPPKAQYMECVKQHPNDHQEKCKELEDAWEKEKFDRVRLKRGAEVANEVIEAVFWIGVIGFLLALPFFML